MKRVILFAIAGLLLVVSSVWSADIEGPHIVVHGKAKKEVTPDVMEWLLNVRTIGGVMENVARDHEKAMSRAIEFLNHSGVKEESIKSSQPSFEEDWKYQPAARVRAGFAATSDVYFQLKDTSKHQALWLGLSRLDGVTVRRVSFELSQTALYQSEARQEALRNAKERAISMAEALGAKVGEPLLIEDLSDKPSRKEPRDYMPLKGERVDLMPDPEITNRSLVPGKIAIEVDVKVAFRLIK